MATIMSPPDNGPLRPQPHQPPLKGHNHPHGVCSAQLEKKKSPSPEFLKHLSSLRTFIIPTILRAINHVMS